MREFHRIDDLDLTEYPQPLSFVFTGLDYDLYEAEQEDLKEVKKVQEAISQARLEL